MSNSVSVCDETIYSDLYRTHAKTLRNHLYYKYGDLKKAEDTVQEAFLKVWVKCSEIVYEKFASFLYTISNNLMITVLRREKVALKFEKTLIKVSHDEDPYFELRTNEFRNTLEKAISNLSEKQREAFLMNRIDKLTYKEIAERLGVSQTAVEKRIAKALLELKNISEIKKFKL